MTMSTGEWTAEQKLRAVERELKMRYRVYPRFIAEGKMTQQQADREVSIFEDIAADYRAQVEKSRLL